MKNKDVLTLIEQVIAVLVFAVVAAICLRVFAFSNTLSKKAETEDHAADMIRNASELIKNAKGDFGAVAERDGWDLQNGILVYERNGIELKAEKVPEQDPYLGYVDITVTDGTEEIISVRTAWQEAGE